MLKIMHIVATDKLSGAEKVVLDICNNLDRDKFEPYTICSGEELRSYYIENGIKSFVIDISSLHFGEINKLADLIKKEKIDIVHGHDIKASIAGYLAARKFKIPVVSHMHASYYWMSKPSPLKFIDRYFRKKYDLSIACSEMARDYYIEHNKSADKNKIITLNNAFNFNELAKIKLENREDFKSALNIDKGSFIFGFLGRLLEIKGVDLLIDSFYLLQKSRNVVLLIVGDGPERNNLEEKVKSYGIHDKVIFAGYQKNVYDYMNIFDCFILPSITEGLPIAVLEAMAMKKAVISTPVAGLKDLMKNDYNGLVLENRASKDLAAAMEKIYNNDDLRSKLGFNAYENIFNYYNMENYIKILENLYIDIIGESRA